MEPEQPIESVLKAAAEKRRSQIGESFRLHAADRRLLQDEVSRTFSSRDKKSSGGSAFLAGLRGPLWPGVGWTFGVLAGVVAAALLMWPASRSPDTQLAYVKESAERDRDFKPELRQSDSRSEIAANRVAPKASAVDRKNLSEPAAKLSGAAKPATALDDINGDVAAAGSKSQVLTKSSAGEDELKIANAEMPAPAAPPGERFSSADSVNTPARSYQFKKDSEERSKTLSAQAAVAAPAARPSGSTAASGLASALNQTRALGLQRDQSNANRKLTDQSAATFGEARDKALQTSSFYLESLAGSRSPSADRQRFTQVAASSDGAAEKGREIGLMQTFDVQYSGNQVQIIDQDGSTYSGELITPVPAAARLAVARRAPILSTAKSETIEKQNAPTLRSPTNDLVAYAFTVSGTNRTLNEKVILTGDIFLPTVTNHGLLGDLSGIGGGSNPPAAILPLKNSKISGDARVGNQTFRFDATPSK
jgi:hypothetical protein